MPCAVLASGCKFGYYDSNLGSYDSILRKMGWEHKARERVWGEVSFFASSPPLSIFSLAPFFALLKDVEKMLVEKATHLGDCIDRVNKCRPINCSFILPNQPLCHEQIQYSFSSKLGLFGVNMRTKIKGKFIVRYLWLQCEWNLEFQSILTWV